jgi:RHS repeat-associated protein
VAVEKWTAGVQDTAYTRRFVYGLDGELLAEIQGAVPSSWETKYLGQDHLGTTRLVMKASGSGDGVVGSRHDYYPFGEELPGRGLNYGDPLLLVKYTGHERDNETGLDFMQARYYGGGIGRFLSPDGPLLDQEVGDPQSWNLYSYVRNSPMGMVDPTGMFEEDPDAPKRVTKPGTSVTVTEAAILVGTVATSSITKLGEKAGEEIAKGMERAYNYFSNFQIPNLSNFCRGSYAALGASIGFFGGSAVGSLGFAGGPAGVFTTSAGAAGGTYVGTSLGIQAGNILCNSGGGGGGGGSSGGGDFRKPKAGLTGKEAAKDVPSWAKGQKPMAGESGKKFAERLLNDKYGPGNYDKGPGSEFSKVQKWGDRAFE